MRTKYILFVVVLAAFFVALAAGVPTLASEVQSVVRATEQKLYTVQERQSPASIAEACGQDWTTWELIYHAPENQHLFSEGRIQEVKRSRTGRPIVIWEPGIEVFIPFRCELLTYEVIRPSGSVLSVRSSSEDDAAELANPLVAPVSNNVEESGGVLLGMYPLWILLALVPFMALLGGTKQGRKLSRKVAHRFFPEATSAIEDKFLYRYPDRGTPCIDGGIESGFQQVVDTGRVAVAEVFGVAVQNIRFTKTISGRGYGLLLFAHPNQDGSKSFKPAKLDGRPMYCLEGSLPRGFEPTDEMRESFHFVGSEDGRVTFRYYSLYRCGNEARRAGGLHRTGDGFQFIPDEVGADVNMSSIIQTDFHEWQKPAPATSEAFTITDEGRGRIIFTLSVKGSTEVLRTVEVTASAEQSAILSTILASLRPVPNDLER